MSRTLAPGFLVLVIAASAAIAGCQAAPPTQVPGVSPVGGSTGEPGSTGAPPDTVTPAPGDPAVAAAWAAIDAANLADPATLEALDAIRFTDEAATAAAQALRTGVTGDALWAATWIYATSGTDPDILVPVISNDDPTVRAVAAAAALSLGRREAAQVLVDLLSVEGNLRGALPPILTSGFAAASLGRYIEGPTIGATVTPDEVTAAWASWLAANGASMQYDAQTGRWRVP